MENSSLRSTVERLIDELRGRNVAVGAPFVADSIVRAFPHVDVFDKSEWDAAYLGVAQIAREILRKRHDDDYDPQQQAQASLDLPEASLLNGAYSVLRKREPFYVPREQMTREDMEYVCAKFDALSAHFARHSRALRAEWERRNALVAA